MNAIVQKKLDRLEAALDTLVGSITSYNPSISAAHDLLAADDTLTEDLDQREHQSNYSHILKLRQTADNLNDRITSVLTLLADTRKEVLATPATVFTDTQRDVSYTELLNYAKNISKYTVPPTVRSVSPPPVAQLDQQSKAVNGAAPTAIEFQTPFQESPSQTAESGHNIGISSLSQLELQWLDPMTQAPFVPWPSEEVIRGGALAQIQIMHEQGVDPDGVGGAGIFTSPEAGMGMREGEDAGTEKLEKVKDEVEGRRRESIAIGVVKQREEKPRVFGGLDLYDPDEEG